MSGLAGFLMRRRLRPSHLVAMLSLHVLISAFALLLLVLPIINDSAWYGVVGFAAALGLLRLLSQFESER
ncbi:MAG: hypothetical protein HOI95_00740 [Chromatiales bacterium]|nr:hypothetical protein [Chromatiales bacterium]